MHLDGRTVDAVVDGVVVHAVTLAHHVVGLQRRVGQIEVLVAGAGCEQRGVALSRSLYHLVLHGEEIHLKLTRLWVGMDGDALLLNEHVGRSDDARLTS